MGLRADAMRRAALLAQWREPAAWRAASWRAAHIDEHFQAERWDVDTEVTARRPDGATAPNRAAPAWRRCEAQRQCATPSRAPIMLFCCHTDWSRCSSTPHFSRATFGLPAFVRYSGQKRLWHLKHTS
jgi:hypothetical protein